MYLLLLSLLSFHKVLFFAKKMGTISFFLEFCHAREFRDVKVVKRDVIVFTSREAFSRPSFVKLHNH